MQKWIFYFVHCFLYSFQFICFYRNWQRVTKHLVITYPVFGIIHTTGTVIRHGFIYWMCGASKEEQHCHKPAEHK